MKYALPILLCVLGAACASKAPPETHFYVFDSDIAQESARGDFTVGIGKVTVAPYLERSELMLQVGTHEVRPARYHRWAEPLQDGVRRYLRNELSTAIGSAVDSDGHFRNDWTFIVDVAVDRLHGDLGGTVVLDATYSISNSDVQKRRRVTPSQLQTGTGYAALVEAQERLLTDLASQVAADIQKLSSKAN